MRRLILGIVVMALSSGICFAEKKDKGLWENLQKLKNGQKVQVLQDGAVVTEGKFRSVSAEEITVEVKKQPVVIKRTDIQRVVLKKGKTSQIIMGLGIGAAIGFVVASTAQGDDVYVAAALFPVLAGGGAGVGAILPVSKSIIYERR